MKTFPTLTSKPDTRHYSVDREDPALRNEMEGGYVSSRPRFTRKPRRTFTIGFTNLSDDDLSTLNNFWDEVRGGSVGFEWVNGFTGETVQVRFKSHWATKYTGRGTHRVWDVTGIQLEEM